MEQESKIENYLEVARKIGGEISSLNPSNDANKDIKQKCLNIIEEVGLEHNQGIQYALIAQMGPTIDHYQPASEQERKIK